MPGAWEIEEVPENGDCFFLALIRQLQELWPALTVSLMRSWIADFFRPENPKAQDVFACWQQLHRDEGPGSLEYRFMTHVKDLETLQKVVQDRTLFWAEHVSIQIVLDRLAVMFGHPIKLMLWRAEDEQLIPLRSNEAITGVAPAYQIYLRYKQGKHYQPLVYAGNRIFAASTIE
jgi:hypothetical protein